MITKATLDYFTPIAHSAFKEYIKEAIGEQLDKLGEVITPGHKGESSQRDKLRHRFWDQLLTYSKTKTELHSRVSSGQGSYCGMGAGTSGLSYCYTIFQDKARVELYIDKGKYDVNKEIFDKLVAVKEEIEQSFKGPLEWERKDEKRACRIKKDLSQGGYRDDEEKWPKVHEAMVDAMIRLHAAFNPHIEYLKK
jgi:hypothetical protein